MLIRNRTRHADTKARTFASAQPSGSGGSPSLRVTRPYLHANACKMYLRECIMLYLLRSMGSTVPPLAMCKSRAADACEPACARARTEDACGARRAFSLWTRVDEMLTKFYYSKAAEKKGVVYSPNRTTMVNLKRQEATAKYGSRYQVNTCREMTNLKCFVTAWSLRSGRLEKFSV